MAELQLQHGEKGTEQTAKEPEGYTAVIDGKTVKVTVDSPTATEDALQAAKDAQQAQAAASSGERPEGLPEKFKTVADMTAAYAELEKKLGGGDQNQQQTTDSDDKGGDKGGEKNTLRITPSAETKMVDFQVAEQEYVENDGKITDATYAAYEKMGLSRVAVDSYIAGQQAQVANMETELVGIAGSADNMAQVLEWALDGVDEATINVYNDAIDNGNTAQAAVALRGIMAQFVAENGQQGTLIEGDRISGGGGSQGYASVSEMTEAMQDPRYKTHAGYRAEVIKRVDASKF